MRDLLSVDPLPSPPRWMFFSGVYNFLWYLQTLPRWLSLSFGLALTGAIAFLLFVIVGDKGNGALRSVWACRRLWSLR